ncbi:MAG TPA: hypothetical protein VD948_02770 [Rhodothermales bacterium]|nr:hypothetical protein [Rhodothermales bacterium]
MRAPRLARGVGLEYRPTPLDYGLFFGIIALLVMTYVAGCLDPAPAAAAPGPLGDQQSPAWSYHRTMATNTVTYPINVSSSTTAPACFPWGTKIELTAYAAIATELDMTCCLTLTTTVALGAQDGASAALINDTNNFATQYDGPGRCVSLTKNAPQAVLVPKWLDLASSTSIGGYQPGLCSGNTTLFLYKNTPQQNMAARPFCSVPSDCNDAGTRSTGNTCSTISSSDTTLRTAISAGCAKVVCRAIAASEITATVRR